MKYKNILVSGGSGYIGSALVRRLMDLEYRVAVLDIRTPPTMSSGQPTFYQADIRDAVSVERVMTTWNPSCVVHLAAIKHVNVGRSGMALQEDVNVRGSAQVFEAAKKAGCKKIVFSSSAAVYGNAAVPTPETAPLSPLGTYGASKAQAEHILSGRGDALSTVILRLFNVSGSFGLSTAATDTLVTRVIAANKGNGYPFTLYGNTFPTADGSAVRDYVHVRDVVGALERAIGMDFSSPVIANIGSGKGTSNLEVIRTVDKVSGRVTPVHIGRPKTGEIGISIADIGRAKELLGWSPMHSDMDDIVRSMYEIQNT